MKLKTLEDALRSVDEKFYLSAANRPGRVHIRHGRSSRVRIPSKSGKGENLCEIVFGHLYEDIEKVEVFWFIRANHSGHTWGHKCIPDIFHNVLSSAPEKLDGIAAKKILDTELLKIVGYLKNIDKTNLNLNDADYK